MAWGSEAFPTSFGQLILRSSLLASTTLSLRTIVTIARMGDIAMIGRAIQLWFWQNHFLKTIQLMNKLKETIGNIGGILILVVLLFLYLAGWAHTDSQHPGFLAMISKWFPPIGIIMGVEFLIHKFI